MSDDKTFGAQFLDAFDAASDAKIHTYAERKEIRTMDRNAVLTRFGLSKMTNAAELTAEEAAQLLTNRNHAELSAADDALLTSALLNLTLITVISD